MDTATGTAMRTSRRSKRPSRRESTGMAPRRPPRHRRSASEPGARPPRRIAPLASAPVIDLHCHLLPAMDDGVETTDEALELGRELRAAGVETVAATPHMRDDYPDVRPVELAGR